MSSLFRTIFFYIILFFLYNASLKSLASQDLFQIQIALETIIQKEMKKRAVSALQITLFQGKKRVHRNYGYLDTQQEIPLDENTLFQVGALVRPLTTILVLKNLGNDLSAKELSNFLPRPLEKSEKYKFNVGQILNLTSGLVFFKEKSRETRSSETLFLETLQWKFKPESLIQDAPQGYAYLEKVIEAKKKETFLELLQKEIEGRKLKNTFVLLQNKKQKENLGAGLAGVSVYLSRKKPKKTQPYYFTMPTPKIAFPVANSLYSTSKDYAKFLGSLWEEAEKAKKPLPLLLFQESFSYDPVLGGTAYGWYFHKPVWYNGVDNYKESLVFYTESYLPGYSALAFVDKKTGYGGVIFINKNDLHFLRKIRSYVYDAFGIMNLDLKYSSKQSFHDIENAYRPIANLPSNREYLNFLNDVQIRDIDTSLELSNVFEKKVFVNLYPLEKDLFLVRGDVKMDGWRILFKRDAENQILGFDSDLVRYNRISKFFTAYALFIFFAFVLALPFFIFIILYIRS